MELIPKQGYIFVEMVKLEDLSLSQSFLSGKVVSGIKEKDMIVFFKESLEFSGILHLVKIEDVLAWVKPEVVTDESKNDQA